MGDLGRRLAQPVSDALSELTQRMPQGLERGHRRVAERIRAAADRFDETERRLGDLVPTYIVDDEGNLRQLTPDGSTRPVQADDRSGVRNLLDANGRATPKRKADDYNLADVPKGRRRRVQSTRVEEGRNPLAWATQKARLADGDDRGVNYAAFHYRGPHGNFILVGRSPARDNIHSEQAAGVPFLAVDPEMARHVTDVYTERGPCFGPGMRNCREWLGVFFPESTNVTHTIDYGGTREARKQGNREHAAYIAGVFGR